MHGASSNTGCQERTQNEFRAVTTVKSPMPLEPEMRLHIAGLRDDYCKLLSSIQRLLQRLGILIHASRKMANMCPLQIKWKLSKTYA